jgi:RimJ/RimL family protein N-acetyltransferase
VAPLRHLTTDRLRLDAVTAADLDDMYALHADPAVWQHYPSGRHLAPERTASMIAKLELAWTEAGLGYWSARRLDDGAYVGIGGCALRESAWWNVYYRLRPAMHGHGYAAELVAAGRSAAAAARPDLPVIAYLVEHNRASKAVAERAGLELIWRGPDAGNPDPNAVRLIYADRPIEAELTAALAAHG